MFLLCLSPERNEQIMLHILDDSNACVLYRCQQFALVLVKRNCGQNWSIWLIKLHGVLKQVVEYLAIDFLLDEEGIRYACVDMNLAVELAFFDHHGEGSEDFFDLNRELRPCKWNIIYFQAVLLYLHLTKLRLDVVLQDFSRTPDDLQILPLLVSQVVVAF